ncbi:cysteine desulfurase, partial [bacterium]|jgi:cysteine desulfurase / selenocysteine lyase|nr:cysteine desulfurase [bacterium]
VIDRSLFAMFRNNPNLTYLDNAATTYKPDSVIEAISHFYSHDYATVGRGIYQLSERATQRYEEVRAQVAEFIGAKANEIIFTRGATDGLNLVATAWGGSIISQGDEVVVTELEHHSNLIPWQQLCQQKGAKLRFIPVTDQGELDLTSLDQIINDRTKLVALSCASNVTGLPVEIDPVVRAARAVGACVVIDAAQFGPHHRIDVKRIDCDFLAISGHKMFGPMGIGVLYARESRHSQMAPYQFGGGMVFDANLEKATWLKAPHKFEAGTESVAQVIGLGATIDFMNKHINFDELARHEASLCARLIDGLSTIKSMKVLGNSKLLRQSGHLVSFYHDNIHPHDIAAQLDKYNIAVRAGHHCAQPLINRFGVSGTVRASFAIYNSLEEVDRLLEALTSIIG